MVETTYNKAQVECCLTAIVNDLQSYSKVHVDPATTRLNRADPTTTGDQLAERMDVERAWLSVSLTDQEYSAVWYASKNGGVGKNEPLTYVELGRYLGVSDKPAKAAYEAGLQKILDYLNKEHV